MPTTMPITASSNLVQLRYIAESTYGTIPVAGNPHNLRMQGETLNFDRTKESDKEISSYGDLSSTITVDAQAGGDLKIHMQYAEYDPFLAAVMRSDWTVYGTGGVGTTFSGTFTTTAITAGAAPTGTSDFTTLQKGQWIRLLAPTDANDGKLVRISTTTAPTATVITLDASTPLTASGPIANCAIQASRVANGTSLTSFTLERDCGNGQFFAFRGQVPSKGSLQIQTGSLIDGSISFMGKDYVRNTATALPGTPVASNTYEVQSAVTGVSKLWEAGVPLTSTYVRTVSLEMDSGLRAQKAVQNLGLVGVGVGTFMAKGTMEVYFADGALFAKFENDTYTSLTVSTQDSSGNGYVFTLPRVMLTNAKMTAGAKDQDLTATFEFTAYRDLNNAVAGLRKTMFIDRVGAAVT